MKMTAFGVYIPKDNAREDAHFISPEFQTIGVADGVGAWRKHGIDSGEYARQLMANSLRALKKLQPLGKLNPKRVLHEAFYATKVEGSSTACILTLSGNKLTVANVGDNNFLVIRNNAVAFRSPTQQKRFNCPFQLGMTKADPSVAVVMEVAVTRGDVVVVGTDGLLDNMHERQIIEIGGNWRVRDDNDKGLREQACNMAYAAHYNSWDDEMESPFSIAAAHAGICHRGGKVDDITLILARID